MKRVISMAIIIATMLMLIVSVCASDSQLSDYEKYYPQFVDSKRSLSELQTKDVNDWVAADIKHPILSEMPSNDRVDYFDIPYGTDPLQKLDIYHAKGNKLRPVIFFIHGGGWTYLDKSDSRYAAPTWVSLGYTVVSINYRFAPKDPHPAQIEDCNMALKWVIDNVAQYGGDPNKIAITGPSSGGHLAALLITGTKWHQKYGIDMKRVKCWIPVCGIYDLNSPENTLHPNMFGYVRDFVGDSVSNRSDASPVNYITGNEPPCLILHGGDDFLVPKTNATELYKKLIQKGVNTRLEIIKHYMHLTMFVDYSELNDEPAKLTNKFLAKYLPSDKNNIKGQLCKVN